MMLNHTPRILLALLAAGLLLSNGPAAAQEYEWEPDEGLHEEEWYDPSDWGDDNDGVDYEEDLEDDLYNWYDVDYWDDEFEPYHRNRDLQRRNYGTDYDIFINDSHDDNYVGGIYDDWDNFDYVGDATEWQDDWNYARPRVQRRSEQLDFYELYYGDEQNFQPRSRQRAGRQNGRQRRDEQEQMAPGTYGYTLDQQLTGRVIGLESLRAQSGRPEVVRLRVRTDDGRTRTLLLGDASYVREKLQRLDRNEPVTIRGSRVRVNGRTMFKARQIASREGRFDMPSYEYDRVVQGTLVGIRRIAVANGDAQALVARVRTPDGRTMDVLLGSENALRRQRTVIRPGSTVNVRGYLREADGRRTFLVQSAEVVQDGRNGARPVQPNQGGSRRDRQTGRDGQSPGRDRDAGQTGRDGASEASRQLRSRYRNTGR